MLQECGPIPELSILNGHPKVLDGPRLLHELVQTSATTHVPAIDFLEHGSNRRTLTYEELHAASNRLAQRITNALSGLKNASAVVPVLLPQSPELYITLLAILKAGRAFCPIGLDTPQERLDFILHDVAADLLITDAARRDHTPSSRGPEILLVDDAMSEYADPPPTETLLAGPAHLAYVLYTSGSTGLPKAVSVSHHAVTQSLLAHDRHIPHFSRFLQFAAPTFDVSIFEIFFTLHRGCTLVGCTRPQMLNDLPGVIASLEVDAAELTPTVVGNLLRGRKSVPNLNLLLTIGEMLTQNIIDEYGGHGSVKSILWGMYGPTEAAIHCTLQPNLAKHSAVSSIGFPLDTVSAFIAAPVSESSPEPSIEILPFGEIGELVIGGAQVADEYLNRPELSAESFIAHPKYGLLYRTGDKARMCPGHTLECLGRIVSGQVKLRGQRVELGEIEQAVLRLDACRSAVVMVIEDTLVAFCAGHLGSVSSTVILDTFRRWLPSYMVPTDVIVLEQMPQLSSGKIDKASLEAQYRLKRYNDGSMSPESGSEGDCSITHIIRNALGRDVPLDAEFGSLGIDSLRSIQVASSLRAQGYSVGAIDILSASNLRRLITLCEERKDSQFEPQESASLTTDLLAKIPVLAGLQSDIIDVLPCTPLQEAMLTETHIRPSTYCNWIEVEIHKPQGFQQIQDFLCELAMRNEILRSGFLNSASTSGTFVQIVWKSLAESAIKEVHQFSRGYSLGSTESLLRPFAVQVLANSRKPRLLFQIHHALYDGWSFDLILQDLSHLIAGREIAIRPQYREVLKYHLKLQESSALAKSKAYWTKVLKDYQPKALPNLNGRNVRSSRLNSIQGKCAVDARSLFICAADKAINPQVFFQAAVAYMLSLYHGSPDILIGTVTSGRTIPVTNVENIVGPCIASLPFRIDISECSLIEDLLHKTQQSNRDMLHHCTIPLRDITKICNLRPGERLFEVLFVWQQSLLSPGRDTLELTPVGSADDLEFKLTLEFEPRNDSILYRITYDPSYLPESQIKYLQRQIDQVVNYLHSNMEAQMDDVAKCFKNDEVSVANPVPVLERFQHGPAHAVEIRALETPNQDALIVGALVNDVMCVKERVSYAALNVRANRLARALVEHGAGNDQLICILTEKSVDLYVSILAVLKAGCGYLPITPDTPLERMNTILADAEISICISDSVSSAVLQAQSLTVLQLDQLNLSSYSDHDLGISYNGSNLAYAVFTSGSTGKPKGVLVTQDNLMSNLAYLSSQYPTTNRSRMLQSCSQAFDVSVFEIFFSWYVGICICTAPMSDIFYNFEAAIERLGVTHLSLTPTVAGLVDPNKVPKVEFLVTAGEALTENVRRKWAGKGLFQGKLSLWSALTASDVKAGYGPSETTNICTVRPHVTTDDLINNIGRPFSNTSVLVMLPHEDCIAPRGAVGELCFGGAQVFRGYLKRPELNAQKIFNHPLYGRIYRSGDMGILLPDDSILSTGRLDDQVKIRGQRVELGEITSLILDHPAVSDCTTLVHQPDNNAQRLVTFWVPAGVLKNNFEVFPPSEHQSCIIDLFETLSLHLPVYMVPTHLVPITRIPMTPQAKVDTRRLRNIFDDIPAAWLDSITLGHGRETSPSDLTSPELRIAEILARTLDMKPDKIGRASSFFNLGLDSVSAIRFAKGLRDASFGHIPVSVILKNPTLERLSSAVANEPQSSPMRKDQDRALTDAFDSTDIMHILEGFEERGLEVQKVLPCTPLQEAMLSNSSPSAPCYYNTMIFDVKGQRDRLKQSWELVLRRHEIFRTAFVPTDHPHYAYAQAVLAPASIQWDRLQSSEEVSVYVEKVLPKLLSEHQPPIRLATQDTGSTRRLIFCCHHALYDGTAITTLLSEIQEVYSGKELPPPISYERFLRHMVTQDIKAADDFWDLTLGGFQPNHFPDLSARSQRVESRGFSISRTLHTPLSESLEYCQSNSVSLLAAVQTAWAKLLHFCTAEEDICFGNVVSGRTLPEEDLDRLVAPCFNTLPVRLRCGFRESNTDICKRLHAHNIDSLPFQLTPLRRIQSRVPGEHSRLFDTLVILQQPSAPLNESIWSLEDDIGEMDLPLVCEVSQHKSGDYLTLVLHYSNTLMQQRDAAALVEVFDNTLRSIVRFPNSPAYDTAGFPNRLLAQSNLHYKSFDLPQDELLHSAFELNAVRRPDVIALDFYEAGGQKQTLTFKALNEKANRIAHALIQHDIGREDIVPVHMAKSPHFYATILGILKAGAAFAPMHPGLPETRKRLIVSELRPKVILCIEYSLNWSGDVPILNVTDVGNHAKENPKNRGVRPSNLAYCLYTSGSTGVPKAVSVEHRAPIHTIESSRKTIPWKHNSRLLQYAAITFDMCYYDCFLAWSFGFTLCASDQDDMLNDLTHTINILEVDLLDLTPSVAASLQRSEVPRVKWLYCIGEAMTFDIVNEWEGACFNSYGPTEAAFCTTIFAVDKETKPSVIGQPFASTSFAVFPAHGERPVPMLGVGELYIGGAQLARGYYGKPNLTEDRFVQKCGQRFYKSGDMVRMLSDGNFEFLGRADDQVKIRGLRVELGEISHVIQGCDDRIASVTTQIMRKATDAKDQLVCFLVHHGPVSAEERVKLNLKAKRAATDQLPAYMIPQFFLFIDRIPRSMAGKVDKKALLEVFIGSVELRSSTNQDENEETKREWTRIESQIRAVFAKLSRTPLEDISLLTTIYQLGLDSISAVQIATALRRQGLQTSTADVMRHINCEDLAASLKNASQAVSPNAELFDFESFDQKHRDDLVRSYKINHAAIEAIWPCTPLQNGILSQFVAKDEGVYFNYLRLQLESNVDQDRLKAAWETTVRKHLILRTGFAHIKDNKTPFAMVQYVRGSIAMPWTDAVTTKTSVRTWIANARREAASQLHLPPWRVRVVKEQGSTYVDLALLHAIFDAQSLRLIFDDISRSYNDKEIGLAPPLERLLSNIIHSNRAEDTERNDFWKQLSRTAAPTHFPNLSPLRHAPAAPVVITRMASRTMAELDAGCRIANISLQVAGIASWATLLSAYTGEQSVTFGVVLSGRNLEGADTAVFPCINTVPIVCNISDRKRETLDNVKILSAEIQRHQFTPLNEIQRLMGYPNEPLFDTIFAFQKLSESNSEADMWTVVDEKATIEYPISIELEPKEGGLEYRLTFLPGHVPHEQASLILHQLDHLLNHHIFGDTDLSADIAAAHPLYSVTPAEDSTISAEVQLLHEMVEHTAARCSDRIALEFATSLRNGKYTSRKWTYAELDREGNRIAHLLMSHEVGPGELVGVCFDKCPEASFAMLGILKAGCAFVALDPGAPAARKNFMVEDSGAKVVFSMKQQSAGFGESVNATILNLDEVDWQSMSTRKPSITRKVDPQDRSYCLYTSGTTGTPKGCELTHENAVQALLSFQRLFAGHWDEESRWLQFASFHFDVSVLEQYWSWSVGICVVSAPRDLIFEDIAASIRTLGITHIDLTPSLARIIHPNDVPSLCKGVFITGGESLKQEILDTWGPKGVIYNGYGPTEATIGVTMYPRVPANGKPSNIGPQFDNVGSYVLRPNSEVPVLRGGVGELCVSGKLVGKGYLNRPDLTSQSFPHLERFNERVYRTGDLVRILHNGTFDFIGRVDDQVKLRGQRLEIGEINSVIKKSGIMVADVATVVLKHPKQQKEQLVSFVVTGNKARCEANIDLEQTDELAKARQACQEKLPPYMVPTHFVALTALPLSTNNKADVRKLKEMYAGLTVNDLQLLSSISQAKDEKFSKQEEKIYRVLKAVFEMDTDFGKDASFFELGMDSISVIGVSRALKEAGFPKAAVSAIMTNTTVRRLATALSGNSTLDDRGSIIAAQQSITALQHRYRRLVAETLFIDARNIEAVAPCTPLQQGMIARSLESDHGLYFNTFYFRLANDIDTHQLEQAWQSVLDTTQIIRTAFVNTEDGFVQAALRKTQLLFQRATAPKGMKTEDFLDKRRKEWVRRNQPNLKTPFELILLEKPGRTMLVVHIFHALYDGNSISLLFRSAWEAYNGLTIQAGPPFQSTLAYGPLRSTNGAKKFWEEHITDRTLRPIPTFTDQSTEEPTSFSRAIENLHNFEAVRRSLNVTAQAIAQACWMAVLQRYIKNTITVGMVVSGRSIDFQGAEQVVGPLFNTIPHQYRPQKRESWTSIIKRTHEFNVAAHPYQHTPLRDIMKWCKRGPNQPLFDTLFVYQVADGNEEWAKNDVWELKDGNAEADYPLAIEIEQRGNEVIKLTLVAQGHVLDARRAKEILSHFETTLRGVLQNSEAILETFSNDNERVFKDTTRDEDGLTPTSFDGAEDFDWTSNANILREEIANLTGTELFDVRATTSIFELGLDSIDAIKLSSKLKKRGIILPVSGIMRSLTIANMIPHISSDKKKWSDRPSDMIFQSHKRRLERYLQRRGLTQGVETILPLTPLQEAMVAEMIASDYSRYYNHDVLRLDPATDIRRLQNAWTEVVEQSPILRTSFIRVDDPGIDFPFAQVVHERPHAFWISNEMDVEPEFAAILASIRQEAIKDNNTNPLFHVRIIRAPQHTYLVLSIAHALYDGWSLGLLHTDVQQAYHGSLKPRPSYVSTLHDILTTSGSDAVAFWRDYLSDAKLSSFLRRQPLDSHGAQIVHRKEQASRVSVPELASFAKRNNITLQTLGQTVYGLTLASYTRSLDVNFGSVLSGRDDEERTKLLFPTMNTVAIRTVLHGTRREMLQYVQDNFSNIKQWQHFPLRKALNLAGVNGSLFESLFIYQKSTDSGKGEQRKLYESIEGHSDVEYPVCVEMEVVGEELMWRCAVKEEVFDDIGAGELLDRMEKVLERVMEQPDAYTIDFTAEGTSICGLSAFEGEDARTTDDEVDEDTSHAHEPADSATASIIREVLAYVSKTPEHDITEGMTIFHIGLDSISAIKVSSLLRKRGIVLNVGEMLKAGTVEKMARMVEERTTSTEEYEENDETALDEALAKIDLAELLPGAGVKEEDVEQVLPATAGQVYMLSMWIKSQGAALYPTFTYEVQGLIDFKNLESAWHSLVAVNPILRSRFLATEDARMPFLQLVLREIQPSVLDTTEWTHDRISKTQAERTLVQPYVHLFVARSPNGWTLRFKIHHALYDGVSLPQLMQQLQGLCVGTKIPFSPNTFGKFIATTCSANAHDARKKYWTDYLKGVTQHTLPQPSSTPLTKTEVYRPGLVSDMTSVEAQARSNGITTQSLLLAVYAQIYARLTSTPQDQDIVIGIYLANRSMAIRDIDRAAIPTVNLVPLRISLPLQTEVLNMAAQIQYDIQEIGSLSNSNVGLWEIREWTGVRIDSFVNFLKLPDGDGEMSHQSDRVSVVQAGQWGERVSRVMELHVKGFKGPRELKNDRVHQAYLVSLTLRCPMIC
jgi:amino acid adenylation domain-containing protein